MCGTMWWRIVVLACLVVWHTHAATETLPGKMCINDGSGDPHCYYAFQTPVAQADAALNCASFGASLILPKTYEQNYDVADFLKSNGIQRSWLDAQEASLTWEEVTGDLSPWGAGKPDMSASAQYKACVLLSFEIGFTWDHDYCTSKHGFVCERAGTAADCKANNQFLLESSCFTYNWDAHVSWFQASTACEEIHSTLAVAQGSEPLFMSLHLRRLQQNESFWIGHTNRVWKDSYDSDVTFFDWLDNQPDKDSQKCAVMLDDGFWMDRDCSQFTMPYVCERKCPSGVYGMPTCLEQGIGDYQSCTACDVYNTCNAGAIYPNRECAGPGQIWDDTVKRCALLSTTCHLPIGLPETTTEGTDKLTGDSGSSSNTLLIGLGVSAAVLIILGVCIGCGVYYTKRKHPHSSASVDGRHRLTNDDDFSVISNDSRPEFSKATRYAHATFLDSDAGNGERYWTWRDAGPKNSRI